MDLPTGLQVTLRDLVFHDLRGPGDEALYQSVAFISNLLFDYAKKPVLSEYKNTIRDIIVRQCQLQCRFLSQLLAEKQSSEITDIPAPIIQICETILNHLDSLVLITV